MEHRRALSREISALPLRRAAAHVDGRLAGVLAALNSATTEAEIGRVVASHAARLWSARGVAVALVEGAALRLTGSVGYDCDTMAPGARLPFTAGLPLTEAARTGQATVHRSGDGAGWVAVPLPGSPRPLGSVVLSLQPGGPEVDVGLLSELAEHAARALRRSPLALSTRAVQPTESAEGIDAAMHQTGLTGETSGDVVDLVADGAGGAWLIVADTCGADAEATRVARDVQLVGRAIAGVATKPAVVLAQMDRVLRESSRTDRFVTAAVAHLQPAPDGSWHLDLAVAGHPLPLHVHDGQVAELGGPGLPLNLGVGGALAPDESHTVLRPGDGVLMWTDGLTDRQRGAVDDADVTGALAAATAANVLAADQLAHFLTALTDLAGPSRDDLAALLVIIP
jgi:hypothetical protein